MGHAVFPSIFKNMQRPSRYPVVIYSTYAFTTICYVIMASAGYRAFGQSVQGNIIDNIDPGITKAIIICLTIVTVSSKFAITSFPLTEGILGYMLNIQNQLCSSRHEMGCTSYQWCQSSQLRSYCIRTIVPCCAMLLAIYIPNFFKLLSIIGGVFGNLISVIIPVICYAKIFQESITIWEMRGLNALITAGFAMGLCAVISSIMIWNNKQWTTISCLIALKFW